MKENYGNMKLLVENMHLHGNADLIIVEMFVFNAKFTTVQEINITPYKAGSKKNIL